MLLLVPNPMPEAKIRLVATYTGVAAYAAPAPALGDDTAAVACGQHLFTALTAAAAAQRATGILAAKDPGHAAEFYRQQIVHNPTLNTHPRA